MEFGNFDYQTSDMCFRLFPAIVATVLVHVNLSSQTILSLQPGPDEGKDAVLHGVWFRADENFGDIEQICTTAWTFDGDPGVIYGLLEFDLSSIPVGAEVYDARLSLYAWNSNTGFGPHSQLDGDNDFFIRRVTTPWNELEVTWNSSPQFSFQSQLLLLGSPDPSQDFLDINVSELVQDMVDHPDESHGFILMIQNEQFYRMINFCSSDHPDSERRPSLIVEHSNMPLNTTESMEEDFTFFPNPAEDYLTISFPNRLSPGMDIIDCTGKLVLTFKNLNSGSRVNISSLPAGIYLLRLVDGNKTHIDRLVKLR